MTISGLIIGIFISAVCLFVLGISIYAIRDGAKLVGPICGIALSILGVIATWILIIWYFQFTASGQRALKTQRSEFGNGIQREITVYDMTGDVIEHYTGKFDVDFSSEQSGERIVFDDEEGRRHVIYPGGGIVIINEIKPTK